MTRPRRLTLVAPDAGESLARVVSEQRAAPLLAQLAGRGATQLAWSRRSPEIALRPWQRGLLESLNLTAAIGGSAALSALGVDVPVADESCWLHAQPVHLTAGMDSVTFTALPTHGQVSASEHAALTATLQAYFPVDGFMLHVAGREWLIHTARALQIETSTPDAAASNELQKTMPRGTDGRLLRRLMTELQMLLHDHPVNQARANAGLPTLNALWLWGAGPVKAVHAGSLPTAFAEDAFTRGIYRLHGAQTLPLTDAASVIESLQERAIVVVPTTSLDTLQSNWIEPLVRGLTTGRIDRLDLVLDEWHVSASRWALRRFWRRPLPLAQWGVTS
jgi:hypothetical protein